MSAGNVVSSRVRRAGEILTAAQKEYYRACAEQCRLDLIEYIEKNNADLENNENDADRLIEGLTFESEYQYDDEGGYYLYDTVYPIVNDMADGDYYYDFGDYFQGYGHEALCVLCGVSTDSYSGSITLDQARQRRF